MIKLPQHFWERVSELQRVEIEITGKERAVLNTLVRALSSVDLVNLDEVLRRAFSLLKDVIEQTSVPGVELGVILNDRFHSVEITGRVVEYEVPHNAPRVAFNLDENDYTALMELSGELLARGFELEATTAQGTLSAAIALLDFTVRQKRVGMPLGFLDSTGFTVLSI